MTVDEQLQATARRCEEEQRPITVEEIMARASGRDGTPFLAPLRTTPAWRHRRHWLLAAAAVIVAVAATGVVAIGSDDDSGSVGVVADRTTTVSTIRPALQVFDRTIAFAADAGAGEALTNPITYRRVETQPEPMDIYVARAGEPARRLVSSGAHERCPAFSPDGERLAYLSVPAEPLGAGFPDTRRLDATLVVLRLDGAVDPSDPELVVPFPAAAGYGVRRQVGYACPQWSPDGSRLAYLAHLVLPGDLSPDSAELRVVTLDGQERVVDAMSVSDVRSPFAWSPSGDALAYLRDADLWTATLDGRTPTLLWQPGGFPTAVSWSSRGELAVTVVSTTPVPGGSREDRVVHVVRADGGSERVGAVYSGCDRSSSWSPDGTRLSFVGADGQLVLHDRDDGSTALLSPPMVDGRAVGLCDVAWSSSGEQLVALAHAVDVRLWDKDPDFIAARGMALLSLSTDGALIDVLTPWSWAFDWTNADEVSSYPSG